MDDYADINSDFDEALRLRDAGDMGDAANILLRLARKRPDVAAVHGMLGHVLEELGRVADAAASYRRATELSPASELSSISLFHALYDQGDMDGAFDEMRRFKEQHPSPEYDQLVNDLKLNLPDR